VLHLPAALQGVGPELSSQSAWLITNRLYCSSECRMLDKGTPSPASLPNRGPVRLTAQMPISHSPRDRSTVPIGPSPKTPAHLLSSRLPGDYSSSSSITSSPIQSPRTNPSASDSPYQETFALPPPAYISKQGLAFSGSVPVKIPALLPLGTTMVPPRRGTPASHGSTDHPTAASVDTLRFSRRPGMTNSITSPNALLPRCACGKPANHQGRSPGRERILREPTIAQFNISPAVAEPHAGPTTGRSIRVVSDSLIPPSNERFYNALGKSGLDQPHATIRKQSDTVGGSHLSRSRSDPIPPSPQGRPGGIAPMTAYGISNNAHNRRASAVDSFAKPVLSKLPAGGAPTPMSKPGETPSGEPQAPSIVSPHRGRSRSRQGHAPLIESNASILNQPGEREAAPSRSRHRRDERRRSEERRRNERDRARDAVANASNVEPTAIAPSWIGDPSALDSAQQAPGGGVAPQTRRPGGGGQTSPKTVYRRGSETDVEGERGRKGADLNRATKQLGQVFGVAAG